MGCCISKCKPKKTHSLEECCYSHVEDKLVISQQPPKSTTTPNNIPVSKKISPCPPSPPSCSSSSCSSSNVSSLTCTTSNSTTTNSCSSSFSNTSSVLSSKDRSFSNEFLWSCVKENPHIIRINSIREASRALPTSKLHAQKAKSGVQQQPPLKPSIPQKRLRSSTSPTPLTRQKSFRREAAAADHQRPNYSYSSPSRTLMRSPSPSRRFISGTDNNNCRGFSTSSTPKEICCSKRMVGANYKVNAINNSSVSVSSSYNLRKENFMRPASPSNNSMGSLRLAAFRNRETFTHRISSKIDETAVREALADHHESESIPMEDIDNPLISLDCFIFL